MRIPAARSFNLNLVISVAILAAIWVATAYQPIVELHAFRQTQTAFSVWAMMHGGGLIDYQTPVLGAPWQVPFEFPIFQWVSLAIGYATHQTIEFSGRLASLLAAIISIWPILRLARRVDPDRVFGLGVAAVILSAPVFAFWARAYMIETTALLFALGWLSTVLDLSDGRSSRMAGLLFGVLLGGLAAATKITTFAPFFGFGLLVVVWQLWQKRETATIGNVAALCLGFALPLALGLAWTGFADHVKQADPLTSSLTSASLRSWNIGNWQDRTSGAFLLALGWRRPLAVLGPLLVLLPLVMAASAGHSKRLFLLSALCLSVYVGGFFVFPKLYRIHDYYQIAVSPFLCAAVAVSLWGITGPQKNGWFIGGLLLLQLSQAAYLFHAYGGALFQDGWKNSLVREGRFVRAKTSPGDGLLVVGTSWNSAIPFYAERRAIAVPSWTTPGQLKEMLSNPREVFADASPAIAVKCAYQMSEYPDEQRRMLNGFFAKLHAIPGSRFGSCEAYRWPTLPTVID